MFAGPVGNTLTTKSPEWTCETSTVKTEGSEGPAAGRRPTTSVRNVCSTAGLLLVHSLLVIGIALRSSPNTDEPAHLAAGLYHWQTGRFDAYQVNPPLVRLWCTIPLALSSAAPCLSPPLVKTQSRLEWQLADMLLSAWTYPEFRQQLLTARLMLLPMTLLGGLYCRQWAASAYGPAAGWAAWLAWMACPNLLAWSATLCPDVAATALGLAACYHFRQWSRTQRWQQAAQVGLLSGLAILAKSTWLVLPLLLWLAALAPVFRSGPRRPPVKALLGMTLLAWIVLHLGYAFTGSTLALKDYRFRSQLLGGNPANASSPTSAAATWLQRLPLLVPKDFVLGVDLQRHEFEQRKWSYLAGKWRWGGWPHYYLACAVWKLPEGYWLLLVLSVAMRLRQRWRRVTRSRIRSNTGSGSIPDDVFLAAMATALGVVVSSQTGFSHHFRYALPCLSFMFILASSCFQVGSTRCLVRCGAAALAMGIGSSLLAWPLSHSYFNRVATHTFAHPPLLESNLEWGEDLDLALRWLRAHPQARPAYHAVMTDHLARDASREWQPAPADITAGWYIVSLQRILDPRDRFRFLLAHSPVDRLGASLRVYHVAHPPPAAPQAQRFEHETRQGAEDAEVPCPATLRRQLTSSVPLW
jgi:hypothetical protein